MNTLTKVLLGGVTLVVVIGFILFGGVVSLNNEFVRQEAGIKAQYKQNQNNYSNYFNKLKEIAQVPKMYAKDLKDIYTAAIKGRYGEGGSKAVFQFLKEQNPNLDASLYTKIQSVIESGRNSFEADQKLLLDKKRVYEQDLQVFPNSFIAGILGFPKIDLDEYDIVINDATAEAFETKRAGPIEL